MADEVARIGALSNGSNGQRSLESASLHFRPLFANVIDRFRLSASIQKTYLRSLTIFASTSDLAQSIHANKNLQLAIFYFTINIVQLSRLLEGASYIFLPE
jgi:hypothetical protein